MTLRAQVLAALAAGPLSVRELRALLPGVSEQSIRNQLARAADTGEVEGLAAPRRQPGEPARVRRVYRLTAAGRYAVSSQRGRDKVNPLRAPQQSRTYTLPDKRMIEARAQRLAQYRLDHEEHIKRQKLLGILLDPNDENRFAEQLGAREATA